MRKFLKKGTGRVSLFLLLTATVALAGGCGSSPESQEAANTDTTAASDSLASDNGQTSVQSSTGITIVNHPVSCKIDDVERANGSYPEIILSSELAGNYPKLASTIDSYNTLWEENTKISVAEYATWANEYEETADYPYNSELHVEIKRVDDKMFSILLNYMDYSGGAHPNHGTSTYNFNPATGEVYSLENVLNDSADFPQIVREKMEADYPDNIEEIDDYHYSESDLDVFEDKLMQDSYSWTLTDEGLHLYFSPYEIASYAAGYFDVVIGNDEYPSLLQPIFTLSESQELDSLVTETSAEVIEVEAAKEDEYSYEDSVITINNPTWKSYCKEDRTPQNFSAISLNQIKEDETDWLDTSVWAEKNNFELAYLPYSDGIYYYSAINSIEYDYMNTELLVYTDDDYVLMHDFDLYTLCNGPDETENRFSNATQYIRWAQVVEDVLYVSVGHAGYASEEPWSGYMVAIDLVNNDLLWRSAPQVSNASNFKIVGDTIICGYGFTAEPDYIYLLNRYNGQVISSIKVNSAPAQFEIVDNTLYVATYNTSYEFEIVE